MGADAIGFVFSSSPRKISPEDAGRILRVLPPFVLSVGVFLNEDARFVEDVLRECPLTVLQFHGEETPGYCRTFRQNRKVIKAFRVRDYSIVKDIDLYKVDGYLLDTFVKTAPGGTGRTFDWGIASRIRELNPDKPVILSGGLNVDNVMSAIREVHPYAVDVSSGVEKSPGIKDILLMERFIKTVKDYKENGA